MKEAARLAVFSWQAHTTTWLVRPILEYGSSVWDPHQADDKMILEKVQRRAARFVTGNYSPQTSCSELQHDLNLNWPTLAERRVTNKLITFHKAIRGSIAIPTDHLQTNSGKTRRSCSSLNYTIPQSRTDTHLYSFFPSTIRLWNMLEMKRP